MQDRTPPLSDMSERLFGFLAAYQRLGNRQHTYDGITLSLAEVRMLDCIAQNPDTSLTQLSEALNQSRSASFQMVKRLTSMGLASKHTADSGHRVVVSLKRQGIRIHTQRVERLASLSQLIESVLERYPPEFLQSVDALMGQLEEVWDSELWLSDNTTARIEDDTAQDANDTGDVA